MKKTCAIIPAAGKGTRLGLDRPKILAPISGEQTIWSILRDKLQPLVDHIQVVLSPSAVEHFPTSEKISVVVQPEPTGMGSAIFQGEDFWKDFEDILIIWGDQVNLSGKTLQDTLDLHRKHHGPRVTMPVVELPTPYVQYDFEGSLLKRIRQTREGDKVDAKGWSDVGTFCLSTEGLHEPWAAYTSKAQRGKATAEINFLPFLTCLSKQGWNFRTVEITDPGEARGVNTPEELDFARSRLTAAARQPPDPHE